MSTQGKHACDLRLRMPWRSLHTHNLKKAFMLSTESYLKTQAPVGHLGLISSLFYVIRFNILLSAVIKVKHWKCSCSLSRGKSSKRGVESKPLKLSSHPHHKRSENTRVNEQQSWGNLSHSQRGSSFWKAFAEKFLINSNNCFSK